jgi:hypothetical protein
MQHSTQQQQQMQHKPRSTRSADLNYLAHQSFLGLLLTSRDNDNL